MGKIRVLFCATCWKGSPETNDSLNDSFNQDVDVSHLATPHVSSSAFVSQIDVTPRSTPTSTETNVNLQSSNYSQATNCHNLLCEPQVADIDQLNTQPHLNANQESIPNHRPTPSPQVPPTSSNNNRESTQQQIAASTPNPNSPTPPARNNISRPEADQNGQLVNQNNRVVTDEATTRLSYDIISVREPLAKILAERQHLAQQQVQARQTSGDHEYIEVYGEKGSSCFYEEIAGSTNSSVTYDQIGNSSNHNYQVLINAYDVGNNSNRFANHDQNSNYNIRDIRAGRDNSNSENVYDVTGIVDEVDNRQSSPQAGPSTQNIEPPLPRRDHPPSKKQPTNNSNSSSEKNTRATKSIPVYSVINKATRRDSAIIRASIDNTHPPQPPPKNISNLKKGNLDHSKLADSSVSHNLNKRPPIPGPSNYNSNTNNIYELDNQNDQQGQPLPQPPPRWSKLMAFKPSNRPLPLPDEIDDNHNDLHNDDLESLNNGYELLRTNFDDDQIDLGYEKIRENRYSGGSIYSQFRPLPALDNGGYESVHPIYSSPSNALVEPNYEAIGPATASELAAAATARLNAATVIEQLLNKD